ncbi:glycosyltransferase family 2 protein [Arhodomonas sp. AD133]|uniref:glycosyltransferase family 2 protein n=1 Tax=Arhodomonas sp. AD133 TaxID=3415009 RepID=UPI003EBEC902
MSHSRQWFPEEKPTVSVVCHTYNHESFVRRALEGFLIQATGFPVEIIVHDDASTDRTPEIVQEFAVQYPECIFPILQEENQFSRGRRPKEFTFPRARGEFIAQCEGDDFWTDPGKLQKQVDAMRRHPHVNLCVHPAMRVAVGRGRQRKGFDHGDRECVVRPEAVIGRHDQFAPTASFLMRREAALEMLDWWLGSFPPPPVGDFFTEAIVGRNGVLYLPCIMAGYRRRVPNSYTKRFRQASSEELETRLARMLHFVERLRGMDGIPECALDQRLAYIRLNYALQFLAIGDRERFVHTSGKVRLRGHTCLQKALATMRRSTLAFAAGRRGFQILRRARD